MKGILIILDGLGDLPHELLKNQTPLEAASTPNLDFFSARGKLGILYPVRPGYAPGSEEGILSIFGNKLESSSRGVLEAIGSGAKLYLDDLCFRVNFATIDSLEKGNIIDRRAGRTLTTSEAKELEKTLNKMKMPFNFEFKSTIQHRGVFVMHGRFSDKVSGNDPTYSNGLIKSISKITSCKALDKSENSQYTANEINEFVKKAYFILEKHKINELRREKDFLPANYLFLRGPGKVENTKLIQYKNWGALGYMPLEIGFSKASGMKIYDFKYPLLKNSEIYENLYEGLKLVCENSINAIKKFQNKCDYMYIQIKETDLPGHDNKPLHKKRMLEYIDKTLFLFLRNFAPQNNIQIIVTGDHSTPCVKGKHTSDPVPLLFYDNSRLEAKHFCERECHIGTFGSVIGNELFKKTGWD